MANLGAISHTYILSTWLFRSAFRIASVLDPPSWLCMLLPDRKQCKWRLAIIPQSHFNTSPFSQSLNKRQSPRGAWTPDSRSHHLEVPEASQFSFEDPHLCYEGCHGAPACWVGSDFIFLCLNLLGC